ncbi:hypothetical protein ID875_16285 [Streptomyces globisporus]|uniref:Uncharacterized protein n=1 Tax=Streptomyces globisporus TaxID=1908 RepID=A0A927BMC7_STRGL|nr:hypothetical protein [Streptomyces globisporus]
MLVRTCSTRSARRIAVRGSASAAPEIRSSGPSRCQSTIASSRSTTVIRPQRSSSAARTRENPTPRPPISTEGAVRPAGRAVSAASISSRSERPSEVSIRKHPLAMISKCSPRSRRTTSP